MNRNRLRRAISVMDHYAVKLDRAFLDPDLDGPELAPCPGYDDVVVIDRPIDVRLPQIFPPGPLRPGRYAEAE